MQDIKPLYSLSEALMREPGYLSELDLRIARLLVAIHSHHSFYSSYPLQGSGGAEVLQLALKTSRLFLDLDQLQSLCPERAGLGSLPGPSKPAAASDLNGVVSEASEETILALEPLYYLDRERLEIGLLQSGLDEKLACHLSLAPAIPARQATQFSHRMSAVTRVVPPPHALTERIVDDIEPQAVLTLASTNRYWQWRIRTGASRSIGVYLQRPHGGGQKVLRSTDSVRY